MNRVWVVYGSTGEFSDWTVWIVAVYSNEEQAREHARLADEYSKDVAEQADNDWEYDVSKAQAENPYDRGCRIDYNGATYNVQEHPLVCHPDEYMELGLTRGTRLNLKGHAPSE